MIRPLILIFLLLFLSSTGVSQSCDNWLKLQSYPSYMGLGDLDITGDQVTCEAEINMTEPYLGGPTLGSDIIAKYAGPADVNYLLRAQNAQITTSSGFYKTDETCPLQVNKTYHVAMVYDGSTLKFYRNGFLMSQVNASGNLIQNDWLTQVGFYQYAFYNVNFIGYINEVRIWNVARTQAQIQANMSGPLPSPTTQPGLLAYYSFNSLANLQGNPAWNGTLSGAASINQTNSNCPFDLDNDCCPQITGTLTGNTICPEQQGQLTYKTTSTPPNPPYTLVYSDNGNNYIVTNVQDNIPFDIANQPSVTAQYPLVKITDAANCATSFNNTTATITVLQPAKLLITPDTTVCKNSVVQLYVSGGWFFTWSPSALLDNPNGQNPYASPVQSTMFYVTGKDFNNCAVFDSIKVDIKKDPVFNAPPDKSVCEGLPVVLSGNNGSGNLYSWSPTQYLSNPTTLNPVASVTQSTVFQVKVTDGVCKQYDSTFSVSVEVNQAPKVIAQKSNDIDCSTPTTQLTASGADSYSWSPSSNVLNPTSAFTSASASQTTTFFVHGIGVNGCAAFDSVIVAVTKTGESVFSVPNAFTPNNDHINDCFSVRKWGNVTLLEFSIYNRWGQRVFESKDLSACWDGTFNGQLQPEGTYAYIIRVNTFCSGVILKKGNLLLIR